MANIVQHFGLNPTTGIMAALNAQYGITDATELWGKNALQTITIARHFPRNPQQAIGYRGVVDYTSGQRTTDLTLDTILTEDTEGAVDGTAAAVGETAGGTSIYRHADNQMSVGSEQYVLTSCNVGFTPGNPATAAYGYITSGQGSAMEALTTAPDVLKDGEEAYFAIVLGDDGSGIRLVSKSGGSWTTDAVVLPSGVQSMTFNSTINKDNILDIRSSQPVLFVTTYPINVTVDLETFDKSAVGGFDAASLKNLGVRLAGGTDHAVRTDYIAPSRVLSGAGLYGVGAKGTKNLVLATGLIKTEESEKLNVGGYLTYTYSFTAADIAVPLKYITLA